MDYEALKDFYRERTIIDYPMTDDELIAYLMTMECRGNLIIEKDSNENIIGLIEFWRINYEQLGRLIIHGELDAKNEDTINGDIAWVSNILIHPDYEGKNVMDSIRAKYFLTNFNCRFFGGNSQRKKRHKTINIYQRTELIEKYLKQEVSHG